jgi:Bacterial Ig-like domain (group 3)
MATQDNTAAHHRWTPLLWAGVPVIGLTISVGVTGTGIDVLFVAVGCLLLFALERTAGDWLGELVGSTTAGVIFAAAGVGCVWYFFFSASGSAQTTRVFAAAEERGYKTAYYDTTPPDPNRSPAGSASQTTAPVPGRTAPTDASASAAPAPTAGGAVETHPNGEKPGAAEPPRGDSKPTETTFSALMPWQHPRDAPAPRPTVIVVTTQPSRILMGRRVSLHATVASEGRPVLAGMVEFSVDGIGAGASRLDASGAAEKIYSTFIAGTYSVLGRFTGTRDFAASVSEPAALTVSPK